MEGRSKNPNSRSAPTDSDKAIDAYNRGDYVTAVNEWRQLAEQGDARAQFSLAMLYWEGHGVSQDHIRAHMWWSIAVLHGHKSAAWNLEICESGMNHAQIEKAQDMARECVAKEYKGC
jgi:TPR repeat protein